MYIRHEKRIDYDYIPATDYHCSAKITVSFGRLQWGTLGVREREREYGGKVTCTCGSPVCVCVCVCTVAKSITPHICQLRRSEKVRTHERRGFAMPSSLYRTRRHAQWHSHVRLSRISKRELSYVTRTRAGLRLIFEMVLINCRHAMVCACMCVYVCVPVL